VISFLLHFPHSPPPYSSYMPCPSHTLCLDRPNYILRRLNVMKVLIMQFSPISYHFIFLQSKYSPQHSVLKHSQSMFLPPLTSVLNTRKNIVLYILILTFLDSRLEDNEILDRSSKCYTSSVPSQFPPESNFDLLLSLQIPK
jgi:hypothetical protein